MKNTLSIFPNGIDDLIYFSDISLDQVEVMNQYQKLLNEGKYTEASQLLDSSEVSFYGAYLLNILENRLNKIGKYLLTKEKPIANIYQDEQPSQTLKNNTVWIGN